MNTKPFRHCSFNLPLPLPSLTDQTLLALFLNSSRSAEWNSVERSQGEQEQFIPCEERTRGEREAGKGREQVRVSRFTGSTVIDGLGLNSRRNKPPTNPMTCTSELLLIITDNSVHLFNLYTHFTQYSWVLQYALPINVIIHTNIR